MLPFDSFIYSKKPSFPLYLPGISSFCRVIPSSPLIFDTLPYLEKLSTTLGQL